MVTVAGTSFRVQEISVRFRGVWAVRDVSLDIGHAGESLIIVGPNGAGKSTLFNVMCGSVRPTSGRVYFSGKDITRRQEYEFARLGIVRKFQNPNIFYDLSVIDNIRIAAQAPRSYKASPIYDSFSDLLEKFRLSDSEHERAGNLPHGKKQWLDIAMTLTASPRLVLLDEPTAGMTAQETAETAELLKSTAADIQMIIIEHDMKFVRAMDLRTLVLHRGETIADGAFSEIENNPMVRDVYLGRD